MNTTLVSLAAEVTVVALLLLFWCRFTAVVADIMLKTKFSHLPAEVVSGSAIGLQQLAG